MKSNKIIAMGLMACISISLLSACGEIDTTGYADNVSEEATEAENTDENDNASEEAAETLTFVHTNDVHGHLEIEPYVKSVANAYKDQNGEENVITASAGDVFGGGEAIAHLTDGYAVRDVMNAAGYDILTIGNNDVLAQCGQIINFYNAYRNGGGEGTSFPILGDNLFLGNTVDPSIDISLLVEGKSYEEGDKPLSSYEIFTTGNGTTVGVFGVGTFMEELEYYTTDATITSAQRCVETLEEEGVDIIVGMIHTGWVDDLKTASSNDVNSYQVAMAVEGIDLIIDGHSHSIINDGNGYVCANTAETLIVQAGCFGGGIGVVNLELDESGVILSKSAFLLKSEEYEAYGKDEIVQTIIDNWMEKFKEEYYQTVGQTKYFLNGERAIGSEDKHGIRLAEQNLGNLITDALRYGIENMSNVENANVVFFDGARVRASIAEGDITRLDLLNVFANGGTVCIQEMTGTELKSLLAESVEYAKDGVENSVFKQVSGLSFTYSADGSIVSVTMSDASELDEAAAYRVAYCPRTIPEGAEVVYEGYHELADALQEYLASEAYSNTDYSKTEGRITLIVE